MQTICTSIRTENHASIPPLSFFTGRMPFLPPNQQRQSADAWTEVVIVNTADKCKDMNSDDHINTSANGIMNKTSDHHVLLLVSFFEYTDMYQHAWRSIQKLKTFYCTNS